MKKKLIVIGVIGILLLMGLSAESIVGEKQYIECFKTEVLIDIIYPQNGATVSGIVTIMVYLYVQGILDRLELYIDDSLELIALTPPYALFWDTTDVSDGYHEIKVIAYDNLGNTASDQIFIIVNNENTEPWLGGPFEGVAGEEYTYCIFGTEDIEAEELYGHFDWGDLSNTGWLGPYSPGEDICASHIWPSAGHYLLKVMLKNETGQWMKAWGVYVIIRKKSKPIMHSLFLQFLERFSIFEQLLKLL